MKNPTNFRKTAETGVDSCMSLLKPWITLGLNFIMNFIMNFIIIFLRSKLTSHDNDIASVLLFYEVSQKCRRRISKYFRIYE